MIYLTSEILVQILIFILVFAVTFQIFLKFLKEKTSSAIISLIVSTLATISLTYYQINFVAQNYSLFGMVALISIPFLIVFFFLYSLNINSLPRRMLFVTYGIIAIIILQKNQFVDLTLKNTITILIIVAIGLIIILDKWIKEKIETKKNFRGRV